MIFNETTTSSLPMVNAISTATDASNYKSSEATANNSRSNSEFAKSSNTAGSNVDADSTSAGTMSTAYDVSDSSTSNDGSDSRISTTVSSSASFLANNSTTVIMVLTTDIRVSTSTSTFTNVSTDTSISTNTNIDTSSNTNTSVSNSPSTSTAVEITPNVSTNTSISTNTNITTKPNTNPSVRNNFSTSTTVEATTNISTNTSVSTNTNINTKANTNTSVRNNSSTNIAVKTTSIDSASISSDASLSVSTSGSFSSSNDLSTNSIISSRPSTYTKVSTSFTTNHNVSTTASSSLISSTKVDVSTDTSFIRSTTSRQIKQTTATEGHSTSQRLSSITKTSGRTTNDISSSSGTPSYKFSSIATTASTAVTNSVSEGLPTTMSATASISSVPGGWIAAPVVCGALLLAAVVTIVILVKLRRMPKCKRRRCFEKRNDGPYVSPLTTLPTNEYTRPVLITDFVDHVANLHKDSDFGFACAFEMLKEQSMQFPKSAAEIPENRPKNRYTNILPFDKDRVKLTPMEDDMIGASDYINASFLPGLLSRREYIATQGPLPGTMDDFWRMIWEYNVTTIVMVTDLVEDGRVLTAQYWPVQNEQPVHYGDVRVELKSEAVVGQYILRIFSVSLDDKSRLLKQFHLTSWMDRSSFNEVDKFLAFHGDVRRSLTNSPLLVHCSAGVGRTGTFIAVDHLLRKVERDSSIDVFNLILEMRSHRVNMVQTLSQYSFVHDCISYAIEHSYHKGTSLPSGNSFRDSNGGNSEEDVLPLSTFRNNN